MNFKFLASILTIAAGLSSFNKPAIADVVVQWQPGDNAANIQKAINTGDSTIIIPQAKLPWLIGRQIYARKSNQKIIFQPGALLLAQKGAFKHKHRSMFSVDADNVTLSGHGAKFSMRRQEYANPALYEKSEWRHTIKVRGARNFLIEGLTLHNSGGDGILIAHGPNEPGKLPVRKFSSGIVRNVTAVDNYRQGLSITSGKNILVENSRFINTAGTNPASGVDLEPDLPWQKLSNIQFKNNVFNGNERNGITVALWHYHGPGVEEISITFDTCQSINNGRYGIDVQGIDDGFYHGPRGHITFKNCQIEDSGEHGIFIRNDQINPFQTFHINFENTTVVNTARKSPEFFPVYLFNTHEDGGIPNINFGSKFLILDNQNRPPLFVSHFSKVHGLSNIHGKIRTINPQKKLPDLGKNLKNVTLKFINH